MKPYFLKYNEITEDYLFTDKHIHTDWIHAKSSILEIIEKSREIGLNQIAITEHCRKESDYYGAFYAEVDKHRKNLSDVEILVGYEAKITNYDGSIDVSKKIKNLSEISIGSVHNFPVGEIFYKPKFFEKKLCQELEFRLTIAGIENNEFDVIGHTGGQSLKYFGNFPIDYFEKIIICCVDHNIAFDLNYSYHHKIIDSLKPLLKKHNPFVSIGSDAHNLNSIGIWTRDDTSRIN